MSSKSLINPIYVIIKKWKWVADKLMLDRLVVFVGRVSPPIEKELNALAKKADPKYKNAELDKYFGKGFVSTIVNILYPPKRGGADAEEPSAAAEEPSAATEEDISIGDIFADSSDTMVTNISTKSILDAIKSAEQADTHTLPSTTTVGISMQDEATSLKSTTGPSLTHARQGAPTIEFIYQTLWSIESPMNLREKIWAYMSIPLFCQYINVETPAGHIPMYYNIYNNNRMVRLNLEEVLQSEEKYGGVPILNHYYAYKDFFFIQSLDNFETLERFVTPISSPELVRDSAFMVMDLYDIRDFLSELDMRTLQKDKNTIMLIYYGFVVLFWPMMTEDVFYEYIMENGSLADLAKSYPELLPRQSDLKAATDKEYALYNLFYTLTTAGNAADKKALSEIEKHLYVRIAKNNINNYTYGDSRQIILSLRNLFDKLVLTENIIAAKYSTLYADQLIELHKTYKTTKELPMTLTINTLVVRCQISDGKVTSDGKSGAKQNKHPSSHAGSSSTLDIYFYENGNYVVKCIWGENTNYTFNEAIQLAADFINKYIITPVNQMKGSVIHHTYELTPITPVTVKYSSINSEIYYRQSMTATNLQLLKAVLRDFYEAKLFTVDISKETDENSLLYFLWKGNFQQDHNLLIKKYLNLSNTYEYLSKSSVSTKWDQIYVRNKAINIALRQTDIRFALSGLWDKEFNIVYSYILLALYMLFSNAVQKGAKYTQQIAASARISKSATEKQNVKSLKQIDPVLYDFKRYNSDLVYSKICQKPNQPKILSVDEYKALSEKDRAKTIKYWNHTTQSETYYYAPNPKYPYINFIVGKHPMNYCIPCAKKTPFEKKGNIKHEIYSTCMEKHQYDQAKKNIITDTRYIMNYGKPIEAGRLCKLPENTLEPLFYESFYENAGFEEECYKSEKFFLVGTIQEWESLVRMGLFNVILNVLEISAADFISEIKKRILAKPNLFEVLMNGEMRHIFYDYAEFIQTISSMFVTKTLFDEDFLEYDWTTIFSDVLFYYFDIVVVEFADRRARDISAENEMYIMEELMPGDFVELRVNQRLDVLYGDTGTQYKFILILTRDTIVTPIYVVNPIIYFKTKVIGKKIFDSGDHITEILAKLLIYTRSSETATIMAANRTAHVDSTDQLNNANTNNVANPLAQSYYTTLAAIKKFCESNKYKPAIYYINAHNLCYYVGLRTTTSASKESAATIFVPVTLSTWSPLKDVEIVYGSYNYEKKMDIKTLNMFLNDYNKWIILHSSDAGIRIDKWIAYDGKVFGFMYGALNYYFNDIPTTTALAIKKVAIWESPYRISDINKQIHSKAAIKTDPLVTEISNNFYESHLYQIILLEYTALLTREKNSGVRTTLKKIIMQYGKESLSALFDEVLNLLDKQYAVLQPTQRGKSVADEERKAEDAEIWAELKMEDYNRIIETINLGISEFMNKNEIYRQIDQSIYNFDKMAINRFKTMSAQEIKKELIMLSKKIIQFGSPPKVQDVPNLLVPCATSGAYYCRANKLIIPEKRFMALLDILVADIKNPMKEKWIFAQLFTDNIINFLKFEYRPLEYITVELA